MSVNLMKCYMPIVNKAPIKITRKNLNMNDCFCDACLMLLPFLPALICLNLISHQILRKIFGIFQAFLV